LAYRFIDHAADACLEVTARSLPELFCEALRGFTDTIVDLGSVVARVGSSVDIEATDLEMLLVDWLNEMVALQETDGTLFARADVDIEESPTGWHLTGVLWGESFDAARHGLKTLVKAVTFHQLRIEHNAAGWRARVVLDL
jgi:SHS2 domain-containing protein